MKKKAGLEHLGREGRTIAGGVFHLVMLDSADVVREFGAVPINLRKEPTPRLTLWREEDTRDEPHQHGAMIYPLGGFLRVHREARMCTKNEEAQRTPTQKPYVEHVPRS